jgi:glutathione S-transferase
MPASPKPALYIGNRNYSSWSLRAWLTMRALGIPFEERPLRLFSEAFRTELAKVSPVARVPVLIDDGFAVWESLAIAEYLAERHAGVWPADPHERARARSICAEMHAGFGALRSRMPMNVEASLPGMGWDLSVQADVDRIVAIWTELRTTHAARGPFLFGAFSAADAFFAPVCSRFTTYAVPLPPACDEYRQAVLALPAMREWTEAALAEHCFLPEDEPYRRAP